MKIKIGRFTISTELPLKQSDGHFSMHKSESVWIQRIEGEAEGEGMEVDVEIVSQALNKLFERYM